MATKNPLRKIITRLLKDKEIKDEEQKNKADDYDLNNDRSLYCGASTIRLMKLDQLKEIENYYSWMLSAIRVEIENKTKKTKGQPQKTAMIADVPKAQISSVTEAVKTKTPSFVGLPARVDN